MGEEVLGKGSAAALKLRLSHALKAQGVDAFLGLLG